MNGLLILASVIVIPYLALNTRRVLNGRRWAFTFCQAAKEWEERERVKRDAARSVRAIGAPPGSASPSP